MPTPVAAVADNTLPLLVSQTGNKCGAAVVKESNFRLEFRFLLQFHPHARWVDWLLKNLEQGFKIGCKDDTLRYAARNLQLAVQHPHFVSATSAAECDKGFLSGPHGHPPLANFVSSGLGVVPKKRRLLVTYLSSTVPAISKLTAIRIRYDTIRKKIRYDTICYDTIPNTIKMLGYLLLVLYPHL